MKKKIVPCLDMNGGRVVKGVKFENLVDAGDPAEIAQRYAADTADEIVFLDITATTEDRNSCLGNVIKNAASKISIPITVGGGMRTLEDIEFTLAAGASKVGINTAAVKDPTLIQRAAAKYGSDKIVVAVDVVKINDNRYNVLVNGGKTDTGIDAIEWCKKCADLGAGELLPTSLDADGTKEGYDIRLYDLVCNAVSLPVTASGGCGKLEDFLDIFRKTGVSAALAASLFHFRELTVPQVKKYLSENGIDVYI